MPKKVFREWVDQVRAGEPTILLLDPYYLEQAGNPSYPFDDPDASGEACPALSL